MDNKTYCIGDVHGCYYTLIELLKKIPNNSDIIFLGDLCDKGNYSKEVISLIIENKYKVIKGNHDYMMSKYLKDAVLKDKKNIWTSNTWGGNKTVSSYKNNIKIMNEHILYINKLPLFLEKDNYFLTHGFGLPYYKRKNESNKQLMSNRLNRPYSDWENFKDYTVKNIYGHCDYEEVNINKNHIGIDTGAVYGRKLTAIELGSEKIIEQITIKKDID